VHFWRSCWSHGGRGHGDRGQAGLPTAPDAVADNRPEALGSPAALRGMAAGPV
jgi:hypothetical protein